MHTIAETINFERSWDSLALSDELKTDVISYFANHPTAGNEIIAESGVREIEFEIEHSYGVLGDSQYTIVSFFISEDRPLYLLDIRPGLPRKWTDEERQLILEEIDVIVSGLAN